MKHTGCGDAATAVPGWLGAGRAGLAGHGDYVVASKTRNENSLCRRMSRKSLPSYVISVAPTRRAHRAISTSFSSPASFERHLWSRSKMRLTMSAASNQSPNVGATGQTNWASGALAANCDVVRYRRSKPQATRTQACSPQRDSRRGFRHEGVIRLGENEPAAPRVHVAGLDELPLELLWPR